MSTLVSLKAMAENKANSVSKTTQFKIHPSELHVEPGFNVRIHGPDLRAHIDAMKAAYRAGAYFPPCDVRVDDNKVFVVEGHCRRTMYLELIEEGLEIDAVEVRHFRGSDAERVAHMLGTAQGKALSPLEQGMAYLRLRRFGWDVAKIASRDGGKSHTHVDNCILLAEADVAVQDMVASGKVSTKVAIETLRKHGSKAAEILTALVSKAEASGVAKVTPKAIAGPSLPKKLVTRFTASLDGLFSSMPGDVKERIAAEGDDSGSVLVPVAKMKELMAAHAEIEKIRNKGTHNVSE